MRTSLRASLRAKRRLAHGIHGDPDRAKRALGLMLTADQIPASELLAMGLVYKTFEDAAFREKRAPRYKGR